MVSTISSPIGIRALMNIKTLPVIITNGSLQVIDNTDSIRHLPNNSYRYM